MPATRRSLLALGATALLASGGAARALFGRGPSGLVYHEDGVAIDGSDAVAYHDGNGPVPGTEAFTHAWEGATWRFASAANRDAFAADPTRWAPAYGGWCAWAVAAKGALAPTRPGNWSLVDGRLYLNFDDAVQRLWEADVPGMIARGDRRWPEIVAARA